MVDSLQCTFQRKKYKKKKKKKRVFKVCNMVDSLQCTFQRKKYKKKKKKKRVFIFLSYLDIYPIFETMDHQDFYINNNSKLKYTLKKGTSHK